MTFPQPTLYREPMQALGHISDTTQQETMSEITTIELTYGQGVAYSNGKLAVAGATDTLYGIVRANEVLKNAFAFEGLPELVGSYHPGETVPVLRRGTVIVQTTAAVTKGQSAILAANGQFAAAAAGATTGIVGTFLEDGFTYSDGTFAAALHIDL